MRLPRIEALDLRPAEVIAHERKLAWEWPDASQCSNAPIIIHENQGAYEFDAWQLARGVCHVFVAADGSIDRTVPSTVMHYRPMRQWHWWLMAWHFGTLLLLIVDLWLAAYLWL